MKASNRAGLGLLIALGLAACGPAGDVLRMDKAHAAIERAATDAAAIRYRDEFAAGPDKAVCGYVNGKNAFGAYTGFQPYVWTEEHGPLTWPVLPISARDVDRLEDAEGVAWDRGSARVYQACMFTRNWSRNCADRAGPRTAADPVACGRFYQMLEMSERPPEARF